MSSLLAEQMSKYGYQVHTPDGRGLMDVDHDPNEQRLFDPSTPGAWPIVVDVQTVADYVQLQQLDIPITQGKGESTLSELHGDLSAGGLRMVPPYPLMFLEYDAEVQSPFDGQARVGVILQTCRLDETGRSPLDSAIAFQAVQDGAGHATWFIEARTVVAAKGSPPRLLPTGSTIYLDEHGAYITGLTDLVVGSRSEVLSEARLYAEWTNYIAMTACKFCHVRKSVVREVQDADTRRRAKKAQKRDRPFIRHHQLVIEPLEKHMDYVRSLGPLTPGSKKALHAVRGHFATYTAERPLGRGKFVGTVWRAPHMRGAKSHGLVTKDYVTGRLDTPPTDDEDSSCSSANPAESRKGGPRA